jgi:hypothetical protein
MSACPPTEVSHTRSWNERLPSLSGDAAGKSNQLALKALEELILMW